MTKDKICEKYGMRGEVFNFYLSLGVIQKKEDGTFVIDEEKMSSISVEKNSIYSYTFSDEWREDLQDYKTNIQNTGKVKNYSDKELAEFNKKRGSK